MTADDASEFQKLKNTLRNYVQTIPGKIYFRAGWVMIFGLTITVWLLLKAIKIQVPSLLIFFALLPTLVLFLDALRDLLASTKRSQKVSRRMAARVSMAAQYLALLWMASTALCALSYVMAACNLPLIDNDLDHIDKAIGFDWAELERLLSKPGIIHFMLGVIYATIIPQAICMTLWFSAHGNKSRLYEIFWIFFLAATVSSILSGFFPAIGPAFALDQQGYIHIPSLKSAPFYIDIMSVRSGLISSTLSDGFQGIITFPSFHTAAAIIYIYAFRRTGIVGFLFLSLNILMLISTPTWGDHYLTDMAAGAAVALTSILIVRKAAKMLSGPDRSFAARLPPGLFS